MLPRRAAPASRHFTCTLRSDQCLTALGRPRRAAPASRHLVRPPGAKQVSAATTRIEVGLPAPGFRLGGRNDDFPLLVRQILPAPSSCPRRETFAQPSFPRTETLAQPSFPRRETLHNRHSRERRPLHNRHSRAGRPCTTVIPAQAGIQGWGFPARNASHLRHAVSRNGSYAKVSESGHPAIVSAALNSYPSDRELLRIAR